MMPTFAARHSMDSAEWYSPSPFVEAAREVMGAIDLDPASHAEANLTVKATTFFDIETNGLMQWWTGRIFLNPPGGKDEKGKPLVPQFWRHMLNEFGPRHFTEAIWIGYSLEQLQTLQGSTHRSPLDFPMCVPRRRIAFVENAAKQAERIKKLKAAGKNPNVASQPSHANYITYLGPNSGRFKHVFSRFGDVRI